MKETYLTVLSTPSYLQGVIILYSSLRKVSNKDFVVLCKKDLPDYVFRRLSDLNIPYIQKEDDVLPKYIAEATEQENVQKFGEWGSTFFKIKMFELTQYSKICYLDSDMIIAANVDNLFDCPHMSAVPDKDFYLKETDDFNSGTLVFVPEAGLVEKLMPVLEDMWENGPYPFGDQNVVSRLYPNWINENEKHLDVSYNAAVSRLHRYPSGIKPKILHYANHYKPWDMKYGYFIRICYCLLTFRFKTIKALCTAFWYYTVSKRMINKF